MDDGHPAHRAIEEFKQQDRNWLAAICASGGIIRSDLLADILTTLLEGARVARQSVRRERPPEDFASMATAAVQSFKEAVQGAAVPRTSHEGFADIKATGARLSSFTAIRIAHSKFCCDMRFGYKPNICAAFSPRIICLSAMPVRDVIKEANIPVK